MRVRAISPHILEVETDNPIHDAHMELARLAELGMDTNILAMTQEAQ